MKSSQERIKRQITGGVVVEFPVGVSTYQLSAGCDVTLNVILKGTPNLFHIMKMGIAMMKGF